MPLQDSHWALWRTAPDEVPTPSGLVNYPVYCVTEGDATVATILENSSIGYKPSDFDIDDFDWWYQCEFPIEQSEAEFLILKIDGLATVAEVWLNGERIITSRNMFVARRIDVTKLINNENTLTIAFRSLNNDLGKRRPRPRWKTKLVENQQLRWVRATLLGRIPGWTPKIKCVGLWKDVRLVRSPIDVVRCNVSSTVAGNNGIVRVEMDVHVDPAYAPIESASIKIAGELTELQVEATDTGFKINGNVEIDNISLWWPHTHGTPNLYDYRVSLKCHNSDFSAKSGQIGFRTLSLTSTENKFGFSVNGEDVFCRGACWTTANMSSLTADRASLSNILSQAVDAGANMIRVGGTMVYESDDFYELCDEFGLMIWQDFMFANMDYPIEDEAFRNDVIEEIEQQTARLAKHPSVVAFCGNSEVEQQAAMYGRPKEDYQSTLFYNLIPNHLSSSDYDQPYVTSSPFGGALPFHNAEGVSHYFGVGAYKRPVSDAGNTKMLFATECLGFSNIPSDDTLRNEFGSLQPPTHSPQWKSGVPRDTGAGWDFEDIRDHYYEEMYGQSAAVVRYANNAEYLSRSSTVTGEVMRRAYSHWRRSSNACRGALIWNMMDIVPGAGWGFIDANGHKKPVFYYLKRAWSRQSLSIIDKGLDGLAISIVNESSEPLLGQLTIHILRNSTIAIATEEVDLNVAPRSQHELSIDAVIGHFLDTTYSYRFGPLNHDVVAVTFSAPDGTQSSDAFFPNGYTIRQVAGGNVELNIARNDHNFEIEIIGDFFLQDVSLRAPGFIFSDNYFHLAPGIPKRVSASVSAGVTPKNFRGTLSALNLSSSITFK